jgi:hypothetical protein
MVCVDMTQDQHVDVRLPIRAWHILEVSDQCRWQRHSRVQQAPEYDTAIRYNFDKGAITMSNIK